MTDDIFNELEPALEEFLKNGGEVPTKSKVAKPILFSLKLIMGQVRRDKKDTHEKLDTILKVLNGEKPDGSDGMVFRLQRNELFRKVISWTLIAVISVWISELTTHWISAIFPGTK